MNDKTTGADIEQVIISESPEATSQPISIPEEVKKVVAAVELLVEIGLTLTTNSPHSKNQFDAAKVDTMAFLKEENIQVDLIEGDYEARLRKLVLSFIENADTENADTEEAKLKVLSRNAIIIALLARLRKHSKFADTIVRNPEQTKLDKLVKSFVDKNGTSPSDAISILRSVES